MNRDQRRYWRRRRLDLLNVVDQHAAHRHTSSRDDHAYSDAMWECALIERNLRWNYSEECLLDEIAHTFFFHKPHQSGREPLAKEVQREKV